MYIICNPKSQIIMICLIKHRPIISSRSSPGDDMLTSLALPPAWAATKYDWGGI